MFNTTVVNQHHETKVVIHKKPKSEPQQDITIQKQQEGTFFVTCRKNDSIWNGLFYKTPFLNQVDTSRGNFDGVRFINSNRIEPYHDDNYASCEQNDKWRKQHNENVQAILRIQAVEVIQIRIIGNNDVIAELRYLNPPEV